jgi:flagellar motor switch protein FliM
MSDPTESDPNDFDDPSLPGERDGDPGAAGDGGTSGEEEARFEPWPEAKSPPEAGEIPGTDDAAEAVPEEDAWDADLSDEAIEAAAHEEAGEEGDGADWGDALAAAGLPNKNKELDQDAIDRIWHGGDPEKSVPARSVMELIANSTIVNYERLPMLDVVLDRLVRLLTENLRQFLSANVEVESGSTESVRFGDYMGGLPLPAVIGVLNAEDWENSCLVVMDVKLVYGMVEVLLGGRDNIGQSAEIRPLTSIERRLVERVMGIIAKHMSDSFSPLTPVTFTFDRLETNPALAQICRSTNVTVHSKLNLELEGGRRGGIDLLIPYATLEPVRNLLVQMFMGEKFGRDVVWEGHFYKQLMQTDIELEAVLYEMRTSLGETLGWRPGTFLTLDATPETPTRLAVEGTELFAGRMGQSRGRIAVKIDQSAIDAHAEEEMQHAAARA